MTFNPERDIPRGSTQRVSRRAYFDVQREFDIIDDGNVGSDRFIAGGVCNVLAKNGKTRCHQPKGWETDHVGYGLCRHHGGNTSYERAKGAWLMAHAIARELNVSPWEALLAEVRRASGEVAFYDAKVAQATSDDDLLGDYSPWVSKWEDARKNLVRVSKVAIDAGVTERFVRQVESDSQRLMGLLIATLQDPELSLSTAQVGVARSILRRELLALGSLGTTIDGVVSETI